MKEKCAKDYYLQTLPPEALPHRPLETEIIFAKETSRISVFTLHSRAFLFLSERESWPTHTFTVPQAGYFTFFI